VVTNERIIQVTANRTTKSPVRLQVKKAQARQHPAMKRESLACLFVITTNERLVQVTANRTTKIAR
jgi:hypothetical protein